MACRLSRLQASVSPDFVLQMFNPGESTAQGTRDARAWFGDDDQADIRGLATAIHQSVAGLPRSNVGDHHADAHIALSRIPLVGARASRDPCVVSSVVTMGSCTGSPPGTDGRMAYGGHLGGSGLT